MKKYLAKAMALLLVIALVIPLTLSAVAARPSDNPIIVGASFFDGLFDRSPGDVENFGFDYFSISISTRAYDCTYDASKIYLQNGAGTIVASDPTVTGDDGAHFTIYFSANQSLYDTTLKLVFESGAFTDSNGDTASKVFTWNLIFPLEIELDDTWLYRSVELDDPTEVPDPLEDADLNDYSPNAEDLGYGTILGGPSSDEYVGFYIYPVVANDSAPDFYDVLSRGWAYQTDGYQPYETYGLLIAVDPNYLTTVPSTISVNGVGYDMTTFGGLIGCTVSLGTADEDGNLLYPDVIYCPAHLYVEGICTLCGSYCPDYDSHYFLGAGYKCDTCGHVEMPVDEISISSCCLDTLTFTGYLTNELIHTPVYTCDCCGTAHYGAYGYHVMGTNGKCVTCGLVMGTPLELDHFEICDDDTDPDFGHLFVYYRDEDGTLVPTDLGLVVGADGEDGEDGEDGSIDTATLNAINAAIAELQEQYGALDDLGLAAVKATVADLANVYVKIADLEAKGYLNETAVNALIATATASLAKASDLTAINTSIATLNTTIDNLANTYVTITALEAKGYLNETAVNALIATATASLAKASDLTAINTSIATLNTTIDNLANTYVTITALEAKGYLDEAAVNALIATATAPLAAGDDLTAINASVSALETALTTLTEKVNSLETTSTTTVEQKKLETKVEVANNALEERLAALESRNQTLLILLIVLAVLTAGGMTFVIVRKH